MVNIYVLELKGGKYYVGKTNHTFQRFNQHKTGSGAKWTQKHKVVDLFAFHKDMRDSDENKITIQMMKKYGVKNVRGGSWTKVNMSDQEIQRLEKRLKRRTPKRKSATQKKKQCTRCGRTSHTATKCYARFHVNGKSLTKKREISKKQYEDFFKFYKQQRTQVAEEDPSLTPADVNKEVEKLEKISEESPGEIIEVMESYSEEEESLGYDTLLSGSNYTFLDLMDDTITAAVQKTVDSVEKQAKKTVKKVNKSAKKLFKGMKKKFKK